MNVRAPIAALLLAALALVAWLALRGGESPQVPSPAIGAPVAASQRAGEAASASVAAQPAAAERVGVAERKEIAPGEAATAPAPFEILVIDAETKLPVADAEVWVAPHAAMPPIPTDPKQFPMHLRSAEERVRMIGRQYRTTADGRVLLFDRAPAMAVARSGQRFGEASIGAASPSGQGDRIRIELALDRTLRLRASDEGGAPVPGLRLSLRLWSSFRSQPGLPQSRQVVYPLGWTDADGRLIVRHAQYWLPSIATDPDSGRRTAHVVLEEGGFDDAARAEFDADAWPQEEVSVSVPAHGAIVVEMRGGTLEGAAVRLQLADAPGVQNQTPEPFGPDRRARFSPVALGRRFRVTHARAERIACELLGPTAPGQTVACVLETGQEPPELRYRLLDPQGHPLANLMPMLHPSAEGFAGTIGGDETGLDGSGRCPLPDSFLVRPVHCIDFQVSRGQGRPPLRARAMIGRALQPGTNDLGDIRFAEPPLLAAGTAVGAAIDTLRNSFVFVEELGLDPAGEKIPWRGLYAVTAAWKEGGRFELYGESSAARLRATLAGHAFPPIGPIEFAKGARNVRFEVDPPGRIEMPLLLDEGLRPTSIAARLTACDGQRLPGAAIRSSGGQERTTILEASGALQALPDPEQPNLLRWSGLAPGRYRIELFAGVAPKPLLKPVEVIARSGETARAPEVDLRGKLRRIRLELQDPSGARLSEAAVLHRSSDPGAEWTGEAVSDGFCDLLLAAPADLAILAPGFRRIDLDGVSEDRAVQLVPGPRVSVQFDLSHLELPAGRRCLVSLDGPGAPSHRTRFRTAYRSGSLGSLFDREWIPIGRDGSAAIRVQDPGDYAISARIDPTGPALALEPRTIRVTDAPEQEFQIRVLTK
jgi:hypothetical protein